MSGTRVTIASEAGPHARRAVAILEAVVPPGNRRADRP